MSASLNARRRERELDALTASPVVDVLVVGGGVTGAGVALDAASRGLSVVLAEKHDLAFGTSRWSSKLVHGGLRYLASGAVGIARESAVERGILIERTAPHLVRPFPQVVPLLPAITGSRAALVRTGFFFGDALRASARTSHHTLPRARRITRAETIRLAPAVRVAGLRGGLLAWDGQVQDDARLVVAIARTAASHGASILTRVSAVEVSGQGAVLRDELTGSSLEVRARAVINATGVWAATLAPGIALRPSRGTHLVVSAERLGGLGAGLTIPVPGSRGRFVFALPSPEGRVYIGLTDEEAPGEIPDVPQATDAEVGFLLDTINTALAEPLTRSDVLGTYAGLRPLLDASDTTTADISRKHAVITGADGLVTVVGGKLTTYRRMAADAVDAAIARAGISAEPCGTADLPLVGAAPRALLAAVAAPARLVARYGTEAPAVLTSGPPEPVPGGLGVSVAELRFAVQHELALDESDLLDRRTRIGLVPADRERALPAARAALDS
jgi:glycerol-3-phosphate dehydrogenase